MVVGLPHTLCSRGVQTTVGCCGQTSFSNATLFAGVTNSDNNGRKIDLLTELYLNGVLVGSGSLLNQSVSGNALNNCKKFSVPLNVSNIIYTASDELKLKVSVRRVGGSGNFGVKLWYNADLTNDSRKGFSRMERNTPEVPTGSFFYLNTGFALNAAAANSAMNVSLTATTTYQELVHGRREAVSRNQL